MIWVAVGIGALVFAAVGFVIALGNAAAIADAQRAHPLPDRTEGMCEYGPCRETWTAVVDLGSKGARFVCDHHVGLIVRENIEPEFEACGVIA